MSQSGWRGSAGWRPAGRPPVAPGPPRPEPRIGDVEREGAVWALGEHFASGRLDQEEFEERSSAAWKARTHGQLAPLFGDLPLPHGRPAPGLEPRRGAGRPVPHTAAWPGAPAPVARPRPRRSFRFLAWLLLAAMVMLLVLGVKAWVVVPILVVLAVWLGHTKNGPHHSRRC